MANVLGKNIIELAALRGMTLRELARRSGTSSGGLTQLINRDQDTTRATTVASLAQALDVDPQDMRMPNAVAKYSKTETRKHGLPIPLIPMRDKEAWARIWESGEIPSGADCPGAISWLPCTPEHSLDGRDVAATTCLGNAMEPLINDGDIVYLENAIEKDGFDAAELERTMPRNGDIVLAWPRRERAAESEEDRQPPILRQIVTGDDGRYWLKAINPDYPGERVVELSLLLGRCVATFRRFR